jgi:hypothetical protein
VTSAGQAKADTNTASTSTAAEAKLEREFERLASIGAEFPIFADSTPMSVHDALEEVAKAYGGINSIVLSENSKLVKLIQAGKLHAVGYALPRPVLMPGQKAPDEGPIALSLSNSGQMVAKSSDILPPAVNSARDLSMALVSTIIPALISQPKAIIQWCALARAALQIEQEISWNAAEIYMAKTLNERVRRLLPFSEICEQALDSARQTGKRQPQTAAGAQGKKPQTPAGLPPRGSQSVGGQERNARQRVNSDGTPRACLDFNSSRGCSYEKCSFAHICANCKEKGHAQQACTAPRRPRFGSSNSVSSAPPTGTAPAAASQQ